MTISLPPELEHLIQEKINTGHYGSAVEVIHEGLLLLNERDARAEKHREELRQQIDLGIQAAEQGKVGPLDAVQTLTRIRK